MCLSEHPALSHTNTSTTHDSPFLPYTLNPKCRPAAVSLGVGEVVAKVGAIHAHLTGGFLRLIPSEFRAQGRRVKVVRFRSLGFRGLGV